jgi:hypothetical protein
MVRNIMRRRTRTLGLSIALVLLGLPMIVRAQGLGLPSGSMPSNLGSMSGPQGALAGSGRPQQEVDPPLAVRDSYVGFLDAAAPRSVFGLRFDSLFVNRQPSRAEYLFAKGGLPNSVGFPLPETRVDYHELTTFAEYSLTPWFSAFVEAPYRWLNPEINDNTSGAGDMRYGLKLCTWSDGPVIASVLLRIYQPTARRETLGTSHWSIEPGILAAWRITDKVLLEGEFRYWTAIGGSDFAGDLLRYGAGISYKHQTARGVWFAPVIEGIGWSVLGGKAMSATSADSFIVEDAHGQTIVNGYAGLRFGFGSRIDMYLGYGRSFTGHFWSRETYRFEVRYSF